MGNNSSDRNKQIDKAKEQKAWTAATLRLVVAGYIAFLGYKIMTNKETTMSHTLALILGVVFAAAAVGILGYIIIRLRIDLSEARITNDAPSKAVTEAEESSEGES